MQVNKHQLEPDMEQWTGSKLGKECISIKAVILSPCLFSVYAEMRNAGLDESQAGISIPPGGLVVKNPGFHPGLISGQGTKILLQTTAHCSVSKISRS